MLELQLLRQMKTTKVEQTDKNRLVNIESIKINPSIANPRKVEQYLAAVQNPYLFRVGDVGVKVHFSDTKTALDDVLSSLVRRHQTD